MATTRSFFKWVFQNIVPGERDPEKRVDADRLMDNLDDLREATAVVEARGANAQDGNSRGNSTPTQCNLTLFTARGERGLLDLGDAVFITDGANKWSLVNDVADDELSFSDADLAEGEGPPDYSAPAFISSLIITIMKSRPKWGKGDLILAGDHPQKLTADDIEAAADDATSAGEKLAAIKERVDAALDAEGLLLPEVVGNAAVARKIFLEEGFQNIIWGQLDADFDNDGLANGWELFNTPAVEMDDTVRKVGQRTQKVIASQPQDGVVAYPFPPVTHADFLGEYVSFAVWVRAEDANAVVVEIDDGVSATTSPPSGVADAWTRVGVEHQVDPAATLLSFRVYALQPTTFWLDGAVATRGRLHCGYVAHPVEIMRTFMAGEDYENAVLNGDFASWTNGATSLPDFWRTGNGVNPPTAVNRETEAVLFGDAALRVTLGFGEGVYYEVPHYGEYSSADVFASVYLRLVSGAAKVRVQIDDGVKGESVDVALSADEWRRPGKAMRTCASPTRLRLTVANFDAAGPVTLVMDGAMITRGQFPVAFTRAAQAKPCAWNFVLPGPVTSGFLTHHGAALDIFPVPSRIVMHKISVYEAQPPAAGSDTFTVTRNGSATTLAAAVATGANAAAHHEPILFNEGDRLQVVATPGPVPGADAGVVVEGYRWGY